MTFEQTIPRIKTPHGIYALLIAANLLMGAVVLEQGRVIENQRVLIKTLFYDNLSIAGMKIKQAVSHR